MSLYFCFSSFQSFVCSPKQLCFLGELLICYCVSLNSLYCASGNTGKLAQLSPKRPQKQKGGTAEKNDAVSLEL